MWFSFKTLASKNALTHGGWGKPLGNNKFVKKVMSSSYHMKKKHTSEQDASLIYTLGERLLAANTFKGLWDVFFSNRLNKFVAYFSLYESSLHFLRWKDQINTVYGR